MADKPLTFRKRKVYKGWRTLWTKEVMAIQEHTCDKCHYPIYPGDIYQRTVMRTHLGNLYVEKEHSNPECPVDPWEEDRRILEEIDKEIREEKDKDSKVA